MLSMRRKGGALDRATHYALAPIIRLQGRRSPTGASRLLAAPVLARLVPLLVSLTGFVLAVVYVANNSNLGTLAAAISELSWWTVAAVLTLFVIAALIASWRLWLIARDIGSPITGRDAIAAFSAGSLAGALFFQIVGQIIARSTFLARRGTPVSATLIMSGYERAAALLVSISLAAVGAWLLFGRLSIDMSEGGADLLKLLAAALFAVCAGSYLGWGRFAVDKLPKLLTMRRLGAGARILLVSTLIQVCTMAAYLVAAVDLAPDVGVLNLAAASAIVMLAASLPISFAGWGIRELGAVLALTAIGMPSQKALVVALLIGAMSLLAFVVILAASFVVGVSSAREVSKRQTVRRQDFTVALAWILPLAAAMAVFFQVHVPTAQGTELNVNLADPFAITAGSLFVLTAITTRTWPAWRVPHLNECAALASLVMTIGLFIGWDSFGWTAWAFVSKFLGWFVLLGYAVTGALLVEIAGPIGRNILMRTFAAAGAAVALVEIGSLVLEYLNGRPDELARASGLAANPNAFALQMIFVICTTLVFFRSKRLVAVLLAIALIALWLSASRAGLGAGTAVFATAAYLLPGQRRPMAIALLLAATGVVLVELELAFPIGSMLSAELAGSGPAASSLTVASPQVPLYVSVGPAAFNSTFSNFERWETIKGGWSLFLAHPLFGAGLGAFSESWRLTHGEAGVIHSTPLWLLAEFGLVGAIVIIVPFLRIFFHALPDAVGGKAYATSIVLIFVGFSVMALAHEMLYQRTFWLLLGALLPLRAIPVSKLASGRYLPAFGLVGANVGLESIALGRNQLGVVR